MKASSEYIIISDLSEGGMASIHLARQEGPSGFAKIVVMKRIHQNFSDDSDFEALFIREAKVLAQLTHQNIVTVHDFMKHKNDFYIIMEYVRGVDLKKICNLCRKEKTPLPLHLIIYIIKQVCMGLDYAHRQCDDDGNPLLLVHRDINPRNILLSNEGEVKIADFGVVKIDGTRLTRMGEIKGKIAYMSPEQALDQTIDNRTDIFATGIVFWELLANRRLYWTPGSTETQVLARVRECRIPDITQIGFIDGAILKILMKALARDKDQRYASAKQMRLDLEQFAIDHRHCDPSGELALFLQQHFAAPPNVQASPVMLEATDAEVADLDSRATASFFYVTTGGARTNLHVSVPFSKDSKEAPLTVDSEVAGFRGNVFFGYDSDAALVRLSPEMATDLSTDLMGWSKLYSADPNQAISLQEMCVQVGIHAQACTPWTFAALDVERQKAGKEARDFKCQDILLAAECNDPELGLLLKKRHEIIPEEFNRFGLLPMAAFGSRKHFAIGVDVGGDFDRLSFYASETAAEKQSYDDFSLQVGVNFTYRVNTNFSITSRAGYDRSQDVQSKEIERCTGATAVSGSCDASSPREKVQVLANSPSISNSGYLRLAATKIFASSSLDGGCSFNHTEYQCISSLNRNRPRRCKCTGIWKHARRS